MPEDVGDKTEAATPRRRQEATEGGHFARSQDLTAAVLLLAGLMAIHFTGRGFIDHLAAVMRSLLGNSYWGSQSELIDNSIRMSAPHVLKVLGPILITMALVSLLVSTIQNGGFRFNPAALQPNLTRLNPIGGLGR